MEVLKLSAYILEGNKRKDKRESMGDIKMD
jgi:hypothetical protein